MLRRYLGSAELGYSDGFSVAQRQDQLDLIEQVMSLYAGPDDPLPASYLLRAIEQAKLRTTPSQPLKASEEGQQVAFAYKQYTARLRQTDCVDYAGECGRCHTIEATPQRGGTELRCTAQRPNQSHVADRRRHRRRIGHYTFLADFLSLTVQLFSMGGSSPVLAYYQHKYSACFVDEFQCAPTPAPPAPPLLSAFSFLLTAVLHLPASTGTPRHFNSSFCGCWHARMSP